MTDEYRIKTKFASKCMVCGNMIPEDETVWWKKGSGVWHYTPCETTEELKPDTSALIVVSEKEWKDFKQYDLKYLRALKKCQRCGTDITINKDSWIVNDRRLCESCSSA